MARPRGRAIRSRTADPSTCAPYRPDPRPPHGSRLSFEVVVRRSVSSAVQMREEGFRSSGWPSLRQNFIRLSQLARS